MHVATTLLGMVDAAIGGKTGVNLPEGKNLVGAFWQPAGVLCDLDALDTLPAARVRCGLRRDGQVPLPHRRRPAGAATSTSASPAASRSRPRSSPADEREGGRRALLNYGHTLAHALEIATEHDLRHGEAVAIGLVYAAELARAPRAHRRRPGRRAPRGRRRRVRPADDAAGRARRRRAVALMGRDKKALDGLTFVLDGPAGVEVVAGVPEAAAAVGARRWSARRDPGAPHRAAAAAAAGPTPTARRSAALNADPAVMAHDRPAAVDGRSPTPSWTASIARWDEHGFGLWCVDLDGTCIGFTGLADARGSVDPASRSGGGSHPTHWGHGYAPEAGARRRWRSASTTLGLDEIVSFTAVANHKSRRVMEKLGMVHDPTADFDHPRAVARAPRPRPVPAAVRQLERRSGAY